MSGRGKPGPYLKRKFKFFGGNEMFFNNNTDKHIYVILYNDPEELICTDYTNKLNTALDVGSHGNSLNISSEQTVTKTNRGGKNIIPIIKLLPKQQKRQIKIKGNPYVLYFTKNIEKDGEKEYNKIRIIEIFKTEKQYIFDINPEDLDECSIELDVDKDDNLLDFIYDVI